MAPRAGQFTQREESGSFREPHDRFINPRPRIEQTLAGHLWMTCLPRPGATATAPRTVARCIIYAIQCRRVQIRSTTSPRLHSRLELETLSQESQRDRFRCGCDAGIIGAVGAAAPLPGAAARRALMAIAAAMAAETPLCGAVTAVAGGGASWYAGGSAVPP